MADTLNQVQLSQIVGAVLAALRTEGQGSAPKAAPAAKADNSLEAKDRALVAGFKRKGIPLDQIVLMDRNDKSKPYTIKPFKQWLAEGRMVKKGEHGIRGLFHVSQTSELPKAKPSPKAKAPKPAQNKPSQLPLA
jgi:hypothetical protein